MSRAIRRLVMVAKKAADPCQTLELTPQAKRKPHLHCREGPSTQYLRTLVPNSILLMVFGTRVLKYWVLGPSGLATYMLNQSSKAPGTTAVRMLPCDMCQVTLWGEQLRTDIVCRAITGALHDMWQ